MRTTLFTRSIQFAAFALVAVETVHAQSPVDPAKLDALYYLMQDGKCDELYTQLEPLTKTNPKDPDLLSIEANCRLRQARKIEQVFDSAAYERLITGSGLRSLPASSMQSLNRVRLAHDTKALDRALSLFSEALKAAPKRDDILAGNVAARVGNGLAAPAIELLKQHRADVSPAVLGDVATSVQDAASLGLVDSASKVATVLAELFPDDPASHGAVALCAEARRDFPAQLSALRRMAALAPTDAGLATRTATAAALSRQWNDALALVVPHATVDINARMVLALCRTRTALASAAPLWSELGAALAKQATPDPVMRAVVDHYLRIIGSKTPPTAIMRMRGGKQLGSLGLVLPAVVEFDSALSLDPKLIEAQKALADVYRGDLRFDDALAALDAGLATLETLPEGASAYRPAEFQADRCAVLYGLGRDKEASEACSSARAGGHPNSMAQAMVALALGRKAEATALLEAAAKEGGEEGATAKAKLEALKNEK